MEVDQIMEEIARRVEEGASARAVFGQPIRIENQVVVPVAKVRLGGGGGGGRNTGSSEEGIGGGMGLGMTSSPVGFIEITPHGAVFTPIRDPGATARSILAGSVAVYLVLRALRKLFR